MAFDLPDVIRGKKLISQIKTLDTDYTSIMSNETSEELITFSSLLSNACTYRIFLLDESDKIEKLIMTKAWKNVRLKLINELIKELKMSTPDKHVEIYEAANKILFMIRTGELTPKSN